MGGLNRWIRGQRLWRRVPRTFPRWCSIRAAWINIDDCRRSGANVVDTQLKLRQSPTRYGERYHPEMAHTHTRRQQSRKGFQYSGRSSRRRVRRCQACVQFSVEFEVNLHLFLSISFIKSLMYVSYIHFLSKRCRVFYLLNFKFVVLIWFSVHTQLNESAWQYMRATFANDRDTSVWIHTNSWSHIWCYIFVYCVNRSRVLWPATNKYVRILCAASRRFLA